MKKSKEERAKAKLVRISPELIKSITEIAHKELRSIPKQIELFLKEAVLKYNNDKAV